MTGPTLIRQPQHPDSITSYIDTKYAVGEKYLEDLSAKTGYQLPHHSLPHEVHHNPAPPLHVRQDPAPAGLKLMDLEFLGQKLPRSHVATKDEPSNGHVKELPPHFGEALKFVGLE